MGITDTVFGTPPQTTINQTGATRPPGYQWARGFFDSLGNVAQQPFPTYQGQLDPGLSPTLAMLLRNAQGYSQAGPPEIMAGVQGSLGRFMNPSFQNPASRMQMGAPNFSGGNPNQRIFGGQTAGGIGGAFGASGVAGPDFTPKPFGGSSSPEVGTVGGPLPSMPPPPGMAKGGMWPGQGGGSVFGGASGDPNTYTRQPNGEMFGTMIGRLDGGGYGPDYSKPMPSGPSYGNDMTANPLPATMVAPTIPGGGAVPNALRNSFGGYSGEQLRLDPSLVQRLGPHALNRWNAQQGPPPPPRLPAWAQLRALGYGGQGSTAANRAMLERLQQAPPPPPPGSGQDVWTG